MYFADQLLRQEHSKNTYVRPLFKLQAAKEQSSRITFKEFVYKTLLPQEAEQLLKLRDDFKAIRYLKGLPLGIQCQLRDLAEQLYQQGWQESVYKTFYAVQYYSQSFSRAHPSYCQGSTHHTTDLAGLFWSRLSAEQSKASSKVVENASQRKLTQ